MFASLFALQLIFWKLERAQTSDKNCSGSIFQPLSYIWLSDIANAHFLKFWHLFQWQSAQYQAFFGFKCEQNLFSYLFTILSYCFSSWVNDKTYLRILSLRRKCVEAIKKSSSTLNPPKAGITNLWMTPEPTRANHSHSKSPRAGKGQPDPTRASQSYPRTNQSQPDPTRASQWPIRIFILFCFFY